MTIQNNMSAAIRAFKELNNKSLTECAELLEISPTTPKEYLAGRGNPNAATMEHLAKKLGIDLSVLVTGEFSESQIIIIRKQLDVVGLMESLSPEQREEFAQHFLAIVHIFDEADKTGGSDE